MFPALDATIRSEIDRSGLTGLAIALVKDGEVVHEAGYGVENTETQAPITPETLFSVMSVTKTIVVTALMQQREAGHFQLDDPANKHLAPVSIKNEWESETPITVRQLMTHTSGMPLSIAPELRDVDIDQFVDAICKTDHRPGERIIYANWGYDALGVLMQRFSGKTVGDCLAQGIFQPLGMAATRYGNPAEDSPHATGHYRSMFDETLHALPLPDWHIKPASPAGGCWSTVGDLAKFLMAHLDGGGAILKPETAAEIHRVYAAQGTPDSGMGLGFRVTRSNGQHLICHGGDGGGFTAFIGAYPEQRTGVALLMNTGGQQTARAVIGNTALGLLAGEPERRSFPGADIPAGLYKSTYWDIEIEVRDGDPQTVTTTEGLVVADELAMTTLSPSANGRFEAVGGMFHGFELAFANGELSGGLYPFEFQRVGEIEPELPVDEATDLNGDWKGTVHTPMAPLAISLRVDSETAGAVSTPLGPAPIEEFRAKAGRIELNFPLSFPGVGDFHNFVRLENRGGRLVGKTYARSDSGENAMRTELERA